MLSSQKILVAFRPRKFKPIGCCYAASNDSRARRAFRSGSVIWTTVDMDSETETPEPSHPWPYLKEMFMFTGSRNESFKFQCLNCLPQKKELLAFKNSPSNLKKHIEVSRALAMLSYFLGLIMLAKVILFLFTDIML